MKQLRNWTTITVLLAAFSIAACGDDSVVEPPADQDKDGVPDKTDPFPTNPNETKDTDGDGVGDKTDAFPNDPKEQKDTDKDGVGDKADAFPKDPKEQKDADKDGVGDKRDVFPNDAAESADTDLDGVGDNADAFPADAAAAVDTDHDGYPDAWNPTATPEQVAASTLKIDAFPSDPAEWIDSDADGVGDNRDNAPLVANPDQADLDGDRIGDVIDDDMDNDGVKNVDEPTLGTDPRKADNDGDKVKDGADDFPLEIAASIDSDGDMHPDEWNADATPGQKAASGLTVDAFPADPAEWDDTDLDQIGNNTDLDDDGDGTSDIDDAFPLLRVASVDTDNDGMPDAFHDNSTPEQIAASGLSLDTDDDNDGIADVSDAFPIDAAASVDTDKDGAPDSWNANATAEQIAASKLVVDLDDDNDTLLDDQEAAIGSNPLLADTDGDLVDDSKDIFPTNAAEWLDFDKDAIGDNADPDDDNDLMTDAQEAVVGTDPFDSDTDDDTVLDGTDKFPKEVAASVDTDGDGFPDAFNAGATPQQIAASGLKVDALPLDPTEQFDTDLDAIGDNADPDDDNDLVVDAQDKFSKIFAAAIDTDADGMPDSFNPNATSAQIAASGLVEDLDDDADGVPDIQDAFPIKLAAAIDTDADGMPDSWNPGVTAQQKIDSGLTEDLDDDNDGLLDTKELSIGSNPIKVDTDNDGVGDAADGFPLDVTRFASFDVLDLPGLANSTFTMASAVNDAGEAVGVSADATGVGKAVLWRVDMLAKTASAPFLMGDLVAGGFSAAHDINAAKVAVGEARDAAARMTAVKWTINLVTGDISAPAALADPTVAGTHTLEYTSAYRINALGRIVGEAGLRETATGAQSRRAVRWTIAVDGTVGAPDLLPLLPGGASTAALYVADSGQIVGQADDAAGVMHGVVWGVDAQGLVTGITDLGAHAGDASSMASAVDGANRIVGRTVDALGKDRAVMWDVSGASPVIREFALTGAPETCAMAASPAGRVGGWGVNTAKMIAAVWDARSTTLTRVEYLFAAASAPAYSEVVGLSNSGAVVGFKQDAAASQAFVGLPIMP